MGKTTAIFLLFCCLDLTVFGQNFLTRKEWPPYYTIPIHEPLMNYSEGKWFEASLNSCVLTAVDMGADGYSYAPPAHDEHLCVKDDRHLIGDCCILTRNETKPTYQFSSEKWSFQVVYTEGNQGYCPNYERPDFVGVYSSKVGSETFLKKQTEKGKSNFCLATRPLPAQCQGMPLVIQPGNSELEYYNRTTKAPLSAMWCSMKRNQCGAYLTVFERRINRVYLYSTTKSLGATSKCFAWPGQLC